MEVMEQTIRYTSERLDMNEKLPLQIQQYYKLQEVVKNTETNFFTLFTCFGIVSAAMGIFRDLFLFYDFNTLFWIIPLIKLIGLWAYSLRTKKLAILYGYLTAIEITINDTIKHNTFLWNSRFLPCEYYNKFWVHKIAIPLFSLIIVAVMLFCLSQSYFSDNKIIFYIGIFVSFLSVILCICFFISIVTSNRDIKQNKFSEKALLIMTKKIEVKAR